MSASSPTSESCARPRPWRVRSRIVAWGVVCTALFAGASAATAGTNRVLGDSISLGFYAGIVGWPVRAFGGDQFTWAIAGASAGHYLANCDIPDCRWLVGAEPDDVWWIMLGSNELSRNPEATAESYEQDMLALISLLPSNDIRLITSPQVYQWPWLNRGPLAALLDEEAVVDQQICAALERVTCVVDLRIELEFEIHYHWDGLHLGNEGHQRIADLLTVPEPGSGFLCLAGLGLMGGASRRTTRRWLRMASLRADSPGRVA